VRKAAIGSLEAVALPEPEKRYADYPHQFSGGQRQRILIAMALANRPQLLIADEPTTALDVTVQAQVLKLLRDLQQQFNLAMLFISHDLAVVAEVADRVAVMRHGWLLEQGSREQIFHTPRHPYTRSLRSRRTVRSLSRRCRPRRMPRLGHGWSTTLVTKYARFPNGGEAHS
jgi:peptide/nickel transport system ATP-binding protein